MFDGFKSRWIKGGENCSCNSITPSQRSGNHCAARATDPSRSYTSSRQRASLDVFHDHHQLVASGMNIVDARQMSEATPGALRLEQVAVGIPHGRINRDALANERSDLRPRWPPQKYTTSVVSWGAVFNTSSTR